MTNANVIGTYEPNVIGTYGTMYYVRDMKKAVAFYRDQLGMSPAMESEFWTEFKPGNGPSLCLHYIPENEKNPVERAAILILQVKGVRETLSQMKANGVEIFKDLTEVCPGSYAFDFIDGSGNIVSLFEAT